MVGQFEREKDTLQVITESAATHVGNIASIITGAIRDIARETGDWLTDVIEMREAAQRAGKTTRTRRDAAAGKHPDEVFPVAGVTRR